MSLRRSFRRSPFDREIFNLAIPALGALASDPLVSLVDTAFVGRLGPVPLAALGVNVSVFSLSFLVFNFLAYGTTPRIGRALGKRDRAAAGRIVMQVLTMAVLAGIVATTLLLILSRPILMAMGASGALMDEALIYLRIRAFAGPALLLITAGHGVFRGYHDTRTPLRIALGLNAVNLILNPLFIFGLGMGIAGAASATLIAQWTGAAWFLVILLHRDRKQMGIRFFIPPLAELKPFLRIGWELSVRTFALIGTMTLATAIATRVGVLAVAAHQVAAQLWMFMALVVDALAVAAQALVAGYLGAAKPRTARRVSDRLLFFGLLVGLLLAGGFALLSAFLPKLFTDDVEVIALVMSVFPFVIAMQPINALVFVWDGIFMGHEDFGYLAKAMVISAVAGMGVLLLVIPMGWGLAGVWWGIVTLMSVRLATLAWRYYITISE